MPNNSPLEYLVVFAIIFVAGLLSSACFGKYIAKIRRETSRHA